MPTTTTTTKSSAAEEEEENCDTLTIKTTPTTTTAMPITEEKPQSQSTSQSAALGPQPASDAVEKASKMPAPTSAPTARPTPTPTLLPLLASAAACNKQLLFCRRSKDASAGVRDGAAFLRNFNSLPLFVYATSPSTHASSADGVGVAREAAAAAATAFTQKVSR